MDRGKRGELRVQRSPYAGQPVPRSRSDLSNRRIKHRLHQRRPNHHRVCNFAHRLGRCTVTNAKTDADRHRQRGLDHRYFAGDFFYVEVPCARHTTQAHVIHIASGEARYERGDYAGALESFQAARALRDDPTLDFAIARCLDRLPAGDAYDDARELLRGALDQAREGVHELAALADPEVFDAGREEFTLETWLEIPSAYVFALERVRPNPVKDALAIGFTLANRGTARLDLFDIAGRRVESAVVNAPGPGRYVQNLAAGRRLEAGIYVIRLTQAGRSLTTRACVVR